MPVTEELQSPPVREVASDSRPSYWTREPSAIYALLSVIAVLPYLNTLVNGFVDDDTVQVLENPFIQHAGHLRQIFTADAWAFYGASAHSDFYRPLMNLTYLVLWKIYGAVPIGYHIANLLLEAGVVCMVYAVTERWTRDRGIAFLSAVVFALHPIHAESVDWIADITDLESMLFLLLSFWLLLTLPGRHRRRWLCSAGMALCFGLALLAKEVAILFPVVATAFEYGYRRDRNEVDPMVKLKRLIPLWIVAGVYLALRRIMLGGVVSLDSKPNAGTLETVLTGFSLFAHYIGKLFWPVNLCFLYRIPHPHGAASLALWAGVAASSLAIALTFFLWKRCPLISFGLLWLLVTLSLSLNIHWLGRGELADRYAYVPSLGFVWIVAWSGMALWNRIPKRTRVARLALAAAAALLGLVCASSIFARNRDWKSNETLYTKTLQQEPTAVRIRINLGIVYWEERHYEMAKREWRRALEDSPQNALALTNLGMAAVDEGDFAEADRDLNDAIRHSPKLNSAYMWRAELRDKQGRLADAEADFQHAADIAPLSSIVRREFGRFYDEHGRLQDAENQLQLATEGTPNYLVWDELGKVDRKLGRDDDAAKAFHGALELNPLDSDAHIGLGSIYEQRGNFTQAAKDYQAGLLMVPRDPTALAGLARMKKTPQE
jgi:tetratricopeptide (TPR) repeat protein